ncbi:HAD family hydrolase [Pedobacter caeni]|uniref:Haloacid dehalogenase superfamily, subfamily IA, variant 3 with third motif having DD or ED/haloacid dehalogenase superfamily, subfamily IA, variant 1 with third motif having Dx(3-4)D or Dx(3-4)E n=1 Tax=Pedobacter caeni TaxID=288992 RepID=A0A1M4ZKS7_9SPHI|nr:HAD family phosphatase [Pedobacter caeni]SHF18643.1 haloacid dehalogenase superfamily, subfamily IA, variant 3 with third motif having DD or ED/haloacid dehalogenase superfamily, subfamily IA, variant 1 with third motif having Dx(3-4)D or Dx(3-4)E [Pedobacter caeni]
MKNIKALLFDLDGTLIDSEYFHYECWNEILEEYNVRLTYPDWLKNYAGIPLPVNAKNLLEKYAIDASLPEVVKRREALTLERLKTKDVNLMPFALEVIRFFHEQELILAIVTSSPREDVEAIFERNGLSKYFKMIITRSEVVNNKPDPESYNKCCELLSLPKENCIVFEDTINGVKAAKAAGIRCFAIQSNTEQHEALQIADKLFPDLKEAKNYLLSDQFVA